MKVILRSDGYIPEGPFLVEFRAWLKERYETETIEVFSQTISDVPAIFSFEVRKKKTKFQRIAPDDMEKLLKNLGNKSLGNALQNVLQEMLAETERKKLPDDGNPF